MILQKIRKIFSPFRKRDFCETCPSYLARQGIDTTHSDYVVALAGNPNTGKSTVFNALTGLRQHTGNWPGKTVTRTEGAIRFNGKKFKLVDLPGTYSLLSASVDEEIARDFILFGRPDCTVVVVDATCLERNLNLVLQVLEITGKAVVSLNLMDEAKRKGIEVNHKQLALELGIPVIPTVAKRGEGLEDLVRTISDVITGVIRTEPHHIRGNEDFQRAVNELVPWVRTEIPNLPNPRWVAMRLLDGDERVREAIQNGELKQITFKERRQDQKF